MDLFPLSKGIGISLSTQEVHEVLCQLLHACWQRRGQRLLEGVKLLPRVTACESSLRKSKVPTFYQKTNIISIYDGKYWRCLIFLYVGLPSPCLHCRPLLHVLNTLTTGIRGCGRISSGEVA